MKVAKLVVSENEILTKLEDRGLVVIRKQEGVNIIHFKALTLKVGKKPAVQSYLSEDELIKNSVINLSDEGLLALHISLRHYVEEVLGYKETY